MDILAFSSMFWDNLYLGDMSTLLHLQIVHVLRYANHFNEFLQERDWVGKE